jgi:hypothetical protein
MRKSFVASFLGVMAFCGAGVAKQDAQHFDFEQVAQSIRYLQDPSARNLELLAQTEAMTHLKRHSDQTGYYPPEASPLDIAADLVNDPNARELVDVVKSLVDRLRRDRAGQQMCLSEALLYGPPEAEIEGKVFFTWGYDIGVAAGPNASLNLAHRRFRENPAEVWYYCIHELHHTLVMKHHPLPRLADAKDTKQFLELIQYLTFLEGTAVYAAYDARGKGGALTADPDYVALESPSTMEGYERAYFQLYEQIEGFALRPLVPEDWDLLEEFSAGDRLWYRVGARMAESIDRESGREVLRRAVEQGPAAFFDYYRRSTSPRRD